MIDADNYFGSGRHNDVDDYRLSAPERIVRRAWPHHLAPFKEPKGVARDVKAHARIEHGRWIVDCPFGCGGAQLASKLHPQFFCVDCLHRDRAEGLWVAVVFPKNTDAIEAELVLRPHPVNRNWFPGETVRQLRSEREIRELVQPIVPDVDLGVSLEGER